MGVKRRNKDLKEKILKVLENTPKARDRAYANLRPAHRTFKSFRP